MSIGFEKGLHSEISQIQGNIRNIFNVFLVQTKMLWPYTHATSTQDPRQKYRSVNDGFLQAKLSCSLYFFLLIMSSCAPCFGYKGQMWVECSCQFDHSLIKESENPFIILIRQTGQSDGFSVGQNKNHTLFTMHLKYHVFQRCSISVQEATKMHLTDFLQKCLYY